MSDLLYQGNTLHLQKLEPDVSIVELCFDSSEGSVNKFSLKAVSELDEVLLLVEADTSIKGLLVTSAKSAFVVGADIKEFGAAFSAGADGIAAHLQKNNQNFNRLEDLHCPVVVALSGYALGGGMEFSLACDCRVGADDTVLGQPEVKLGIIPGWGGTVRLPRLCGLDVAVEWIASGKSYTAVQAQESGLLDAVVAKDQLRSAAIHTLQECMSGRFDYLARRRAKVSPLKYNDIEAMLAFESAKAAVSAKAGRHYPAPVSAITAMQKSAKLERDSALAVETRFFVEMAQTDTARSLVGVFLRDQFLSKKSKTWASKGSGPVARAGVLGAGIMGGGIAYQSALKGVAVSMKDVAQSGLDLGLAEASKLLAAQVDRHKITVASMANILTRIEPTLSYQGFDSAEIVVEAVVENPVVKAKVLQEAQASLSEGAILVSNTSSISITHLAQGLPRPDLFCGMHFFNPVHKMPLVEVIRGEKTADTTIATTVAFATQLGKKAVVVNDCPGFLINRVLFPYLAGFAMLVRDGADFSEIDNVMERWGWPMGPAYLLDVVGLDTAKHAEGVMAKAFPARMGRVFTSCVDTLFDAGRLGQKTLSGFYDYTKTKSGKPQREPSSNAGELLGRDSSSTGRFSEEEILARMMVPMVTELVRCLDELVVETPEEADMALIYGLGFPPFRGGVFHWLDSIGLKVFCNMAKPLESLGELYCVPASLKERAALGQGYYADSEVVREGAL